MKIEINEDIENYKETVLMGLTARQAVFSILSLLVGAGIVLSLYEMIGMTVSCYLATLFVIPIALMGFYQYNGMNFFQFVVRFVRSFTLSKPLPYRSMESRKAYEKLLVPAKEEVRKQKRHFVKEKQKSRNIEKQTPEKQEPKKKNSSIMKVICRTILVFVIFLMGYLYYVFGFRQGMDMREITEMCIETLWQVVR